MTVKMVRMVGKTLRKAAKEASTVKIKVAAGAGI